MRFEEIYARYFKQVYSFALSLTRNAHLAEELTQETFFRAMKNPDAFLGRSSVGTYLCAIVHNLYVSAIRRNKHESAEALDEDRAQDGGDLEEALVSRDTARHLHRLLHRLDEPYKEVFTLRVFGDLSYEDIGALFQKSAGWTRVTYFRARQKLQQMLKEEEECQTK